jgi:ribonucleotide reductase beta subunit family protein with ferritin-like domain
MKIFDIIDMEAQPYIISLSDEKHAKVVSVTKEIYNLLNTAQSDGNLDLTKLTSLIGGYNDALVENPAAYHEPLSVMHDISYRIPAYAAPLEPNFTDSLDRFIVDPSEFRYEKIAGALDTIKAQQWTEDEIDSSHDKEDYEKLDDAEKHYIFVVLAFFMSIDGIVDENLVTNFARHCQIPEAKSFWYYQGQQEAVHSATYANVAKGLGISDVQIEALRNAITDLPVVRKKAEWTIKWMRSFTPVTEKLIAFAICEGVLFSSSFCAIFWLRNAKQGLTFGGLEHSNRFIKRDEDLHMEHGCLVYELCQHPLPRERILEILLPAVEMECEYVDHCLPESLDGISADSMKEYVKFCADRFLKYVGEVPYYGATVPFAWMEQISTVSKSNFFERKEMYASHVGSICADTISNIDDIDDKDF